MIISTPTAPIACPIDATEIRTQFFLHPALAACSPDGLNVLPPDIRPLIRSIATGAKAPKFFPRDGDDMPPKYDPTIPTRTIRVDAFDAVILTAEKNPTWTVRTIRFNPGTLLFGHNGRILTEPDFQLALSALLALLSPLLAIPDDWIHIAPGLHQRSRAYWRSIEIPFHATDDDGDILKAFTTAKHPDINSAPLHARAGQTLTLANSSKELIIRVYRKDLHMAEKKGGSKISVPGPMLRMEVALQGEKLREYLNHATWREIDGTPRLISFRPADLKQAHFDVMSQLKGCYTRLAEAGERANDIIGRLMGWVTFTTGLSLDDQFEHYKRRSPFKNKDTQANTKSRLFKAARDEMSLLSQVHLADLFCDSAWLNQPVVTMPKLEQMTQARHANIDVHPLVAAVYASSPRPSQSHL